MSVNINGNTGVSQVQDTIVSQGKLGAGVAGTGPAFSAYQSSAQSLASGSLVKLNFQTKEFDTANAYDNVTNFRFQPLVAGYYQVNGAVNIAYSAAVYNAFCSIYKNGTQFKTGSIGAGASGVQAGGAVSALVFLNGSTDYVEIYGYHSAGSAQNTSNTAQNTYFQASLVRAA